MKLKTTFHVGMHVHALTIHYNWCFLLECQQRKTKQITSLLSTLTFSSLNHNPNSFNPRCSWDFSTGFLFTSCRSRPPWHRRTFKSQNKQPGLTVRQHIKKIKKENHSDSFQGVTVRLSQFFFFFLISRALESHRTFFQFPMTVLQHI